MSRFGEPKSEALRRLYWRDEILQLLFWIQGEGFAERIEVHTLERFLGLDVGSSAAHLERLTAEGLLARDGVAGYRLSERGRAEGGRIFAEEFAQLTQPSHGACGPECWCRASSSEAAACEKDRRAWTMSW